MATANVLASSSITPSQSVNLVRNMLRAAFSTVAYIRNLFDRKNFNKSRIGGTAFFKLRENCAGNAAQYKKWLNEGVFDALAQKYLSVIRIEIYKHPSRSRPNLKRGAKKTQRIVRSCENLIECYAFHVTYSGDDAKLELSVKNDTDIKRVSVQEGCSEMLARLVQITEAMEGLPSLHVVSVKLLFTEDTPDDYQPPMFTKARDDVWFVGETIDVGAGNVQTPFHNLKMQVYARNTEEHRQNLVPLSQADGGSIVLSVEGCDGQAIEQKEEAVGVASLVEDDNHAVTPENRRIKDGGTERGVGGDAILGENKGEIQAVNDTHRVDGGGSIDGCQRVEGATRESGIVSEAEDVGEDGRSKMIECKKMSASMLPPLFGHSDRVAMAATQDSDFEATQVKRCGKRKMGQTEKYIVVRKTAKRAKAASRRRIERT